MSVNYKSLISLVVIPALLFVFVTAVYAEHDSLKVLRGPAFSDPSKIRDMPADWKKQSIKHDSSTGDTDLAINLDQQMYRILGPIVEKFAKEQNIKMIVTDSTCGNSSGMLRRKMIDIGGFCCPPDVTDRLPGLRFHTLGIVAVALLVHPDNPIEDITLEQAREIFSGRLFRWSEVNIEDSHLDFDIPIKTIGRLHCKKRPGHWRLLIDNEDLFSPRLLEVGAIPDMVAVVAANQGAIGHGAMWLTTDYYKNVGMVKTLKINGYSPKNVNALLRGDYSIYKVFNITTWEGDGHVNPLAQKLADYILKQVERIGREYNVVPASSLRKAGWKFKDNELIGEPR